RHRAGNRAVVNQRELLGPPTLDVPVERVVAGVELPTGKPAIKRRSGFVQDSIPVLLPADCLGPLSPEAVAFLKRAAIRLFVRGGHCPPLSSSAVQHDTPTRRMSCVLLARQSPPCSTAADLDRDQVLTEGASE